MRAIIILLLIVLFTGCASKVDKTLKECIDDITVNRKALENRKIAVMDIIVLETEVSNNFTKFITEKINTELTGRIGSLSAILLERSRIASILKEFKFQMSDLADPESAKKLGKALGADLVVVGTMSEKFGELNLRLVEIENYGVIAASHKKLSGKINGQNNNVSYGDDFGIGRFFAATFLCFFGAFL